LQCFSGEAGSAGAIKREIAGTVCEISMSADLIAGIVAVALGLVVVVLGLRRNLSETTRNGLPRFGEGREPADVTLGLYEGGVRPRRPLSPRQRRWMVSFYLLLALTYAAVAVFSTSDRPLHASMAGIWTLGAVLVLRRGSSDRSDGSAS